jgi:hypothetical protein
VYAVGHKNLTVRGRWIAAVLACGREAVLSHRSAARLWGLLDANSPRIDVTTPNRGRTSIPGIRRHRVRHLAREDATTLEEIRVTTVARTLFDLAEVMDLRTLEGAFEIVEREELPDMRAVFPTAQRNPGAGRTSGFARCWRLGHRRSPRAPICSVSFIASVGSRSFHAHG